MRTKLACTTTVFAMVLYAWIAPLQVSAGILPPPGSLIVTITSPASGSSVTGTIPVNASVSVIGSLTVAGVQFKRDGVNIGTQDTSSPYSVSWNSTTTSNGQHTLTAVARDLLGAEWTSNPITVTVSNDTTPPTVRINQASAQADPTRASPINFTAVFSEAVSGFTNTDVTIGGTAGGLKTVTLSGGPGTYNLAVSGMTTPGTVVASIAAGVAKDAAGNTNTASTSTDNQVSFDATPPAPPSTPDLASASDSGVSNTDNLTKVKTPTFTGTAEAGSTVKIFSDGVQVGSGTATGGAYSIATSSLSDGARNVTATATDATSNVSPLSGALRVTIDTKPPTVSINQASSQADPTGATSIAFTAVFSEAVSGFTGVDVTISGSAGGPKTVTVSGGPSTHSVAVSGMTTDGTVIATIAAGVAQDAAGNTNTASTSTDNQVTFDAADTTPPTPPSVPDLAAASDSGVSATDNLTNVTTPTFTGTAEVGSTVKLFSDGVQVGSGAAPGGLYSITTTSLSDGTKNITATATDAANNVSSSSGALSVTINTTPPAVAVTSPASGATVSGTETVTADASDDVGIAGVQFQLDGADAGAEDTTAPYSVSWDTTHVGDGSHTITAVARDAAGNRGTSAPVTVTVSNDTTPPPGDSTRFEENSPAISAGPAGAWVLRGAEVAAFSGGAAGSSDVSGATATFTFTGTAVSWIGLRCSVCGIASVSIDGGAATSVDTAGPAAPGSPGLTSEVVFAASGLAPGTHSLVITVTGATTSGGAHIIVDAFDVVGAFSRFEEIDPAISAGPAGAWVLRGSEVATFSGGSAGSSDVSGATATFTFTGRSVSWIGLKCSVCGIASVSIDGGTATSVDTAGPAAPGSPGLTSEVVFTASGLAAGTHTMVITVTGTTASGGAHIIIDAFDVSP